MSTKSHRRPVHGFDAEQLISYGERARPIDRRRSFISSLQHFTRSFPWSVSLALSCITAGLSACCGSRCSSPVFDASQLNGRLSLDFSLPGQPGDNAEQQLIDAYGVSTYDTYIAVVTVPQGGTVESNRRAVAGVFAAAAAAVPDLQLRVVDFASTGDPGFVTDDGRTTYALVQAPTPTALGPYIEAQLDPALEAAAEAQGFDSGLTSYGLLAAGCEQESASVLVETLLAAAGALLVLLFVFASFLALLPLLVAAVSILTTFMLVLRLTAVAT